MIYDIFPLPRKSLQGLRNLVFSATSAMPPPGGTHMLGCAAKMGWFLCPIFHEKSLTMGLIFNFENFVCFCGKITKNGYFFFFKNPKYLNLFLEILPLNMGMGLELLAVHPRPIQT